MKAKSETHCKKEGGPFVNSKADLLSMTPTELERFLSELGEAKFRAKQLFSWLHRGAEFAEMHNLSSALRQKLAETAYLSYPKIVRKLVSNIDGTVKYLFAFPDGEQVETVIMQYEHGNTACVSSQVGCRMGCRFCASTLGGLVRSLTAGEILSQVIVAQKDTGLRISNIVLMGIGEPLDNYDNVLRFLELVHLEGGLHLSHRHISLSTCGLADKIRTLAKEDLQITLSISLHAATDQGRSAIMPINNKWNLDALLSACRDYFLKTGRRISFEYTLIAGQNDSVADAKQLASTLHRYLPQGMPLHVNLIPLNPVNERAFTRSSRENISRFTAELQKQKINATVRRRLGPDINASCGQLRHNANAVES